MHVRPVARAQIFDAAAAGVEHDPRQRQQRRADLDAERPGRVGPGQGGGDGLLGPIGGDARALQQLEQGSPREVPP
jgi:hypothetical protein